MVKVSAVGKMVESSKECGKTTKLMELADTYGKTEEYISDCSSLIRRMDTESSIGPTVANTKVDGLITNNTVLALKFHHLVKEVS